MAGSPIKLSVHGSARTVEFEPERLVIAGYTGSDPEQVRRHIEELEAEGVAPPERTPTFFRVPVDLLTTEPAISVSGDRTSGEVEPVLFCCADGWFLGVGSDHTDRELERQDVAASKAACPKPVATEVIPYERAREEWPLMSLVASADGTSIQDGGTAGISPVAEVVAELERSGGSAETGLALFLGTVPLSTPGFVFGDRYSMELGLGDGDASIEFSYEVADGAAAPGGSATVSAEGGTASEA
jgi:4-hydroxyphenylacetate 3-monooxygenase